MSSRSDDDTNLTWPVKAYKNLDFLNSPDARTVRVLCEFIEPAARFRHLRVRNTIVFFGSTRITTRDAAEQNLRQIENECSAGAGAQEHLEEKLEQARRSLIMSRYYEDAALLAEKLTRWSLSIEDPAKRFYICSCGGPGIMEAAKIGRAHV